MLSFRLKLDLSHGTALHEAGFRAGVLQEGNRLRVRSQFETGEYRFYVLGRLYCNGPEELAAWIARFSPEKIAIWAQEMDGDYFVISLDSRNQRAWLINDRNGGSRVYYSQQGSVLCFSNSHLQQILLLDSPRISSFGAFQLLTSNYVLDPYSLLEHAKVGVPGQIVNFTVNGLSSIAYYVPVKLDSDYYDSEEECVRALDSALESTFAKLISPHRSPCVLLSGGIDSVCMLRYISRLAPGRVRTLTFAVQGSDDERRPAQIAARHFNSDHHELTINPQNAARLYVRSIFESDSPNYSFFFGLSGRDLLEGLSGDHDVFTGQDTRLHTPTLDYPRELGIYLNRRDSGSRRLLRSCAESAAQLLQRWPFYPQGYLRYWAKNLHKRVDFKDYVACSLLSLSPPVEMADYENYWNALLNELPHFSPVDRLQEVFKKLVAFEYRLQYSDDMHVAVCSMSGNRTELMLPFYDWEMVEASNRVPYHLGRKPILTLRSWSRIPLVRKRILRKLLSGSVPPEVLYRTKATRSTLSLFFNGDLAPVVRVILDSYTPDLLDSIDPLVGSIIRARVEIFSSKRTFVAQDEMLLWSVLQICHLGLLHRACCLSKHNISSELEALLDTVA